MTADAQGQTQLTWKQSAKQAWAQLSEGCYVLRTNVADWSDEELWRAYIQLTEAEAAFRLHKTDLSLRPVWHQKAERVQAHILVCFLAYVPWKFLGQLCHRAGLGDEPRRVLQELSELRVVEVGLIFLPHCMLTPVGVSMAHGRGPVSITERAAQKIDVGSQRRRQLWQRVNS